MAFSLPENLKIVHLFYGATNAAAHFANVDVISCANAHKVWILGFHTGANATTCVVSLYEATDVAAGTHAAITATWPCWKVVSSTSLDTLSKVTTDAASLTIDPDGADSPLMFLIEWDCAKFSAGYDCLTVDFATGHGNDRVDVFALIQERYPSQVSTQKSAITD